MSSEFDTAVTNVINNETTAPDKAQAAREGYVGAVDTNPDEYAEMQRVARRVGVPTNVAMDMPQEVKKQASIGSINFDTLAQTNPATASLLADTNKAKIAHDDVPNLQATERSLNGDIIERMQRGYVQGRSGLIGGTIEPMQRGYAQGRSGLTLMLHSMGLFKGLEEQKRAAAESNGISYDPTVETATMMAQRQREVEKYPIPEDIQNGMNEISKAPDFASAFESALSNPRAVLETTLQSLGTSFPALATTAGGSIFGPVGTAAGAGMGSFAVEYGSTLQDVLTDKGMDPNNAMDIHRMINDPVIMDAARDKAIKRGIPVAIFDAITAGVAGKLLAGAKATPLSVATRVGGELAVQAGGGAAGEAAAQAATGEFKPGDIIMEAIAELPTGLVEIPGNYKVALGKAQRSEDNTRFVETLNDLSSASKVLQRDPETFEAFVNHAAENGPVDHVYIDASTLMQSGVADQIAAVSPSVAEQLPLAQSTGGQISIPVGEYAARIAPTEYAQALVDHIKTSPDEFSRAEAADFMQNHQEELQKEIERSLGNAQLNDEFKQSTARLKEKFQTELDAVGHHTTDVNKTYATLLGDYFAVNAAKMGMSPEELHNQYALRFASELQQGYDQSRVDMHFKDVTKRIEGLTIAANDLKEGKISREDYDRLVNELKPVTPYASTPEPSSTEAMQSSLTSDKVPKIGRAASILHTGDHVGLRLDIPAYRDHGTWVVSIHSARASDKSGMAGKAIGYDSVAAVTDARFGINEKAGINIAAGKPKATIATVEGKWAPITPEEAHAKVTEALQDPEWVQVGMDPERHSYFYDRKSMEPVVSADEVVQIGPLLMAKNPVYAPKDHFLYQSNNQSAPAPTAPNNPHTLSSLTQAIKSIMDKAFGDGWTNRLLSTGKFKVISRDEAVGLIGKNAMFHKVWHGSPHDHDKFDSSKIGTGEGAQAFGYGLYFTDAKSIAEWYRDKLSGNMLPSVIFTINGKEFDTSEIENDEVRNEVERAIEYAHESDDAKYDLDSFMEDIISDAKNELEYTDEDDSEYIELNERISEATNIIKNADIDVSYPEGKLYEVDLAPSQDEYLDWDKPLSEQSETVKNATGKYIDELVKERLKDRYKIEDSSYGFDVYDKEHGRYLFNNGLYSDKKSFNEWAKNQVLKELNIDSGNGIYNYFINNKGSDKAASEYLNSIGIRGIRYKAEGGKSDANNYVIFDDNDINIEAKYSKDGQVLAFYNPADDTTYFVHDNISQDQSADSIKGLMLHEIGVHALQLGKTNVEFKALLTQFERLKETNPRVKSAFDRVPDDTKEEHITEEALSYFLENNPTSTLAQRIIEAFRQLVRAIGNTLIGKDKFKYSQWANNLTEQELRNMATIALMSAPESLLFDNIGGESNLFASKTTGNNGNFDPNDANIYHQFAGVQAWTADTHALTKAIERIKKGENPEQVRKETGWHTGADGVWRFEISDDKAKFNTPYDDWTADRIREEIQVQPNPDEITGLYRAIFREGTPDHFGSMGRSEEEAINNVVRNVRNKRFADEGFDINKVSDGDTFVLSHVLSHSDLFDAYPSLLNLRVHFEENTHAYNGNFNPNTDVISLAITGDEKQMLSTLLHEIQHAIQEKEGFGLGGNTSKYFTDAVKTALGNLSKQHEEKIAEWTNANFDKMVDHRVAAKVARYGLMYESAQRLIGYANRSEPSGVFRLIRQEMQWIYSDEFSKNDKAQDLQRDFYNIPKRHKKNERNAFIGDMAFRAGRVLLDEIGPMYQGQFKNDPRTMKGMLKALEREADKKRQALTPLRDFENEAWMAENVKRAHSFSSPYDVYQSLAGEVEARNTQARQGMTPEERRNTSPKQSADVPIDKIIVRFGGLEIRAPMASIAEQATYNQGANTNRGSFNPTNLTISLLKKADLTTFLHETGHFFLEMQMDLAAKLEHEAGLFGIENLKPGEQSIIKDANTLLDWFGVQDLDTWHRMSLDEKRGFHEQTARGFEVYLFEGNAPSIELQPVFQRFKEWLKRVYKSIEALNVVLTDEVRGVFDRMLASEEQIQLAQQARSMMPLFATLDAAPMSADEFREYQNLQQDATASAVDELDARGLRDMKWLRNARSKVLKAMQKDAKEKRREVRAEARIEVLSQPIYRAWALLTAKINPEDRLPKPNVTKSNPNVVTPEIDSLFAAVAKLGGLNKSELMSSWDLDPAYKPYSGVFGKPTWRKDGGLSIDSMLEALTPYGYLTLDHHGKPEDSREFEELFDRELRGDPQYSFERDYNRDQEQRAGGHIVNPYALNAVRFDKGELLAANITDEDLSKLQAYKMVSKGDGMHQDIVADLILDENGNAEFTSGDDLIQYLLAATPPNEEIEALTDLRMLEKYGDLSSPGAIEKAADKAIHNDLRARLVATEANALAKATGGKKILASAAKMLAATTIARKKIRDLIPSLYTNAEVRAAKSAEKYMRAKDLVNAAAEKRNQLFNMFAAKAAMDARDEVEKGLRYLKKFNGNIKGIDADYADQIAAILSRFDLRKISNKEMDRRKTLDKWLTAQEEEGLVPDLPEHITNEAFIKPYKELSVEEFRGVIDSVKQIEHLGRLKKKLLLAKDQREFDAIRDEIVQSINDNSQGRIANTRTINTGVEQAKKKWGAFAWGHAKVATLAKVLDGGNIGGPVWEFLIRPANERGDWETTQRAEATLALSQILAPVFNLGKMGGKGLTFQTVDRSFNREARIAIALNVGNEGNLQRLLGGEGWSLEQIMPILKTLTREEWTAVQAIWDHFETYRPLIAAKERRVYGKEPNWVEPTPFNVVLADGETVSLRGGYYPIKYDPAASQRAEEHSDAEAAKRQLQGAYTSATTRRSFTKARAEEVKGRPLLYSLSGVYAGVNDVIHDLAWHEWLIDTNRLIKNTAIDTAIRQHYGPEFKNQFKTWTSAIAEGEKGSDNTVDIALSRIRQGVSVSGLGFNVMSAAMQPTGITQSISVVGAKWVGLGVSRYLADISGSTRTTNELSEFMANRARTRFRELNELRNSVEDQSPYKEWLGRYAYFLMMRCQQMVDVPTWIGAYEKALAEGVTDDKAIALADQAVIDSQGSGMLKDLSAIERGGAAQKLFTVFYSYMNTALNVGISKTMSAELGKRKAKLAADYLLLYVLPPVLGFAIKEALTPTGDDDDDYWEKLPKRLASNQIDYLMGLMVVVREFSEAAKLMTGVEDHKQDYQGPAGVRMIADSVKFGEQLGQGEFDTPFRKSFVNLMGDAFALPSAQINRTVTGIEAISEGKTSNPAAIAFGFKEHH